ncbi:translation initiation factor IF-2 [Patescibacteria group bacterium]
MNVTEMYRELKMTKDEFFELVQELGFDIGERAIKVDDAVAMKIIEAIKAKRKKESKKKIFTEEEAPEEEKEEAEGGEVLKLPDKITVKDFAEMLDKRAADMIAILMQNGIMATINESLDYETAAIIAEDMGYKPELSLEDANADSVDERAGEIVAALKAEKKSAMRPRPPVVVIMGHVDHGKTKLLDAIRETDVVAGEAGGITQHIGAYQVERKGKSISFIDTPGHEAFTTMRARGARVADIAILVVAADDGVKPQTIESIHIMEEAGLPFVVAINKIDKPEADIEKVKKELSELNLVPEDYGGKTICVPISAKEKQGLEELLDTVLLVMEMEKDSIMANPEGDAVGTIIESHVDKNIGPVATVLIQNGTLRISDIVQVGKVPGRVRSLKDWHGREMKEAGPSMPAQVLGLKKAPIVGDVLKVAKDKKVLKQAVKEYESFGFLKTAKADEEDEKTKLKIILRADKLGSLEAIFEALQAIKHEEVGIDVIQKGLGSITENDIALAMASNALVLGFSVGATSGAEKFAKDEAVEIARFDIIYELIDHARAELEKLLKKEVTYDKVGALKILKLFRQEQTFVVAGGRVTDGEMRVNAPVKIVRSGKMVGEGVLVELQKEKKKTSSVGKGSECGMKIESDTPLQEGDVLEAYEEKETARKL